MGKNNEVLKCRGSSGNIPSCALKTFHTQVSPVSTDFFKLPCSHVRSSAVGRFGDIICQMKHFLEPVHTHSSHGFSSALNPQSECFLNAALTHCCSNSVCHRLFDFLSAMLNTHIYVSVSERCTPGLLLRSPATPYFKVGESCASSN